MLGLILLALLVLVFCLTIFHLCFLWNYVSLRHIPGPSILQICKIGMKSEYKDTKEILKLVMSFLKTYGPMIKVPTPSSEMLIITSDKDTTEFFLRSPKFITKSYQYDYLASWLGEGILFSDGEVWKKTRKLVTQAFHFKILEEHLSVFDKASDIFIDVLYKYVDNKEPFDIYPLVTFYTLDIISETAMGIKLNVQKETRNDYVQAIHFMTKIPIVRSMSLWKWNDFLFKFSNDYAKQQASVKILDETTVKLIKERKQILLENNMLEKNNETKKSIFLDILLTSTVNGEPLSDDKIKYEVNSFMFGGHDTTASSLGCMIYALANNPHVQNKVFDEIKMIFEDDKNRYCTMQDLNDMKYTELVIKEVLRYYTTVPFLGRRLKEDVEYNGTIFPKGITLMFFTYAMHKNPEAFKNPLVFDPDRFLDTTAIKNYTYLPFSAGPRNCLGQRYAMLELKLAAARLLRHFEFLSGGPEHKLELRPELIMKPDNGIYVKIKRRDF